METILRSTRINANPLNSYSGEGRAHFLNATSQTAAAEALINSNLVSTRYVDNHLRPSESYPANPNGSPGGIAGIDPLLPPHNSLTQTLPLRLKYEERSNVLTCDPAPGLRSKDGRVLAMMPHPERCVMNPGSWVPAKVQEEWGDFGPWIKVFQNARRWVG